MHECSQAGHREVQHVSENEDYDAEHPVHSGDRDVQYHTAHKVERIAEHTASKPEGIETYVAEHVTEQTGHHIVGVPKSRADIHERIASRGVEREDGQTADDS